MVCVTECAVSVLVSARFIFMSSAFLICADYRELRSVIHKVSERFKTGIFQ